MNSRTEQPPRDTYDVRALSHDAGGGADPDCGERDQGKNNNCALCHLLSKNAEKYD